jgi:hypothetical protein
MCLISSIITREDFWTFLQQNTTRWFMRPAASGRVEKGENLFFQHTCWYCAPDRLQNIGGCKRHEKDWQVSLCLSRGVLRKKSSLFCAPTEGGLDRARWKFQPAYFCCPLKWERSIILNPIKLMYRGWGSAYSVALFRTWNMHLRFLKIVFQSLHYLTQNIFLKAFYWN